VDSQINKIEAEIHEHLEIDHGDVTTYVNMFDAEPDYIHVMIGKTDNSGKLNFNKLEMFLSEEQFQELAGFFSSVSSKVYLRNSAARLEEFRKTWAEEAEKQVEIVDADNDHIDIRRPNLCRQIQDGVDFDSIKFKMRESKDYCKRFYATLCNNELFYGNYKTGYSWRATGGLIADIIAEGDYMDWYCSGGEGNIDEEVQQDLLDIGWEVKPYPDEVDSYTQQRLL
jgi:hypothetical protein